VGGWKEGYRETWVPVDPVTFENGAMQYWRGSHRDGKLYKPNVFISQSPLPGSEGHDLPDIENNMDDFDIIHFDVQPGDVLVHHYRTIHGTGGNRSRYQVRRAASIRYCVGIARNEYHRNEMHLSKPLSQSDALVFAR
jgi:ectoine hydroxylase-related dioxygenase (phytanoyl-CoA dioxygenase family)